MSSLEALKQELLTQRSLIESKGGTVEVAHTNPSPSEITAGINTIQAPNMTLATATEENVLEGKTFYAGNSILKTGTFQDPTEFYQRLFMFTPEVATETEKIYYTLPAGKTQVRNYLFNKCKNTVYITFNDEVEDILEYAFADCDNFVFTNFNDLKNIKNIKNYAFSNTMNSGIDFSCLPDSIETIMQRTFANNLKDGTSIGLPKNLITLNTQCFYNDSRKVITNLSMPSITGTLPALGFYYCAFDCDFTPPATATIFGASFNYNGSFHNITVPATITALNSKAFGADSTEPMENFYMKTLTFESETPPTIGANLIASQHVQNGLKIYVPDTAVDTYKATKNLTTYASIIYPMSEKV
ncbi:MAG: leucine-rich repeat domain-containing protein [Clostridiales bacterium]|nr:leucine-rich repeat domain-containing protein [Clostridiales bacterium]